MKPLILKGATIKLKHSYDDNLLLHGPIWRPHEQFWLRHKDVGLKGVKWLTSLQDE